MKKHALVASLLLAASSIAVAASSFASLSDLTVSLIDLDPSDGITPHSHGDADAHGQRWDTFGKSLGIWTSDTDFSFGEVGFDVGRWAFSPMTRIVVSGRAQTFAQAAAQEAAYAGVQVGLTGYRGTQRFDALPGFGLSAGSDALARTPFSENRTQDFSLTFDNPTRDIGYLAYSYEVAYRHHSLAPTTPVPEPAPYALLLAGLGVVALVARRRARLLR